VAVFSSERRPLVCPDHHLCLLVHWSVSAACRTRPPRPQSRSNRSS
jgi:hypothetical protein